MKQFVKRASVVMLAFALLLTNCVPINAAIVSVGEASVVVTGGKATYKAGQDSVIIPVYVSLVDETTIGMMQFRVKYDDTALEIQDILTSNGAESSVLSSAGTVNITPEKTEIIWYAIYAPEYLTKAKTDANNILCWLKFKPVEGYLNGEYKVGVILEDELNLMDGDGKTADIYFADGTITLEGGVNIKPTITTHPKNASYTYEPTAPTAAALTVVADNGGYGDLTYQWYDADGEISGATAASYTPDLEEIGAGNTAEYYCKVTNTYKGKSDSATSEKATVKYNKAEIDVSGLTWDYTAPLTYTGSEQTVELANVPENVKITYENNKKTDVDTYTAAATAVSTNDNYIVKGNINSLNWKITNAKIKLGNATPTMNIYDNDNAFTISSDLFGGINVVGNGTPAIAYSKMDGPITVTDGEVTATGIGTGHIKAEFTLANHDKAEATITVNVASKQIATVTFAEHANAATYNGQAHKLSEFVGPATVDSPLSSNAIKYYVEGVEGAVDLNTYEITDAGSYKVTAVYEDDTYYGSKQVTITIDKDTIAVDQFLTWQGDLADEYDGTEKSVTLKNTSDKFTVSGYSNNKSTDAGSWTAEATLAMKGAFDKNYKLDKTTVTQAWSIAKAQIDLSTLTWNYSGSAFTYDGTKKTVEISSAPAQLNVVYRENTKIDAGEYTASATATVKTEYDKNYKIKPDTAIKQQDWEIAPAAAQNLTATKQLTIPYYSTSEQFITVEDLNKALTLNVGTITITGADADGTIGELLTITSADDKVSYKLNAQNIANVDKAGAIKVTFTSPNLAGTSSVTFNIKVTDKVNVDARITFADSEATYDGTEKAAAPAKLDNATSSNFNYKYFVKGTETEVRPIDAGEYTVVATYEDDNNLGTATATFTINKAKVTGQPSYEKSGLNGKTLADAKLDKGTITVPGEIKWEQDPATKIEAGKKYTWIFEPTDTKNYEVLTGEIMLYSNPFRPVGPSKDDVEQPVEPVDPEVSFIDVPQGAWYYDPVYDAVGQGLFNGTSANTFTPNGTMTRAMVVTVLHRMEGKPENDGFSSFADVPGAMWFSEGFVWANQNGIVTGYGNGLFGTNNGITREQLAAILYRYAGYKGYDVSVGESTNILSYGDAFAVSEYAIPAMQWAVGSGLINGIDGNLVPGGFATRAQVATILTRFLENVAK